MCLASWHKILQPLQLMFLNFHRELHSNPVSKTNLDLKRGRTIKKQFKQHQVSLLGILFWPSNWLSSCPLFLGYWSNYLICAQCQSGLESFYPWTPCRDLNPDPEPQYSQGDLPSCTRHPCHHCPDNLLIHPTSCWLPLELALGVKPLW